MSSVTTITENTDSSRDTRLLFNRFFDKEISYPSNQVDAVIGFFEKRGFEKSAAISIGTVLLQQAKIDNINVFELLDTIKLFDKTKLSNLVAVILNENRSKISKFGYKINSQNENIENRNIIY